MDVVIIGAGYTGLASAYRLLKEGRTITVLEASRRVGGRTLECFVKDNRRLELGGQYITPAQARVTQLVSELGMETFPSWSLGDSFLSLDNQIARYQSSPVACLAQHLPAFLGVQQEIECGLHRLAAMFPHVPASTPWTCQLAEEWDALTFQSWLNDNLKNEPAKQFFRFMTNQGFSTEPEQISLLQMLWFLRTSHGLPAWALGGGQANRVVGGTQRVAERLAERLGDKLVYGEEVTAIEQDAKEVHVRTKNRSYRARVAIVCIPPQLITAVHYTPPLPSNLFRAFSAFQIGNSMKVQAIYERPFWRELGWSGSGIAFNGTPTFTYDNSGPDGLPGVLLGFLSARHATEWTSRPKEERKRAILQTWAQVFGDEVWNFAEYVEMDWMSEPFIRGGHGCHFPPGAWCELGPALGGDRMPHFGRILWGASDLAKDWNGYLEGALLAGEQVAQEAEHILFKRECHAFI